MQIHGPSETPDGIAVRLNRGNDRPFAVLDFGSTEIFVESVADADKLVEAAVLARSLLLCETSKPLRVPLDIVPDSDAAGTDAS